MATNWFETITKTLEGKKRYNECKARMRQLPGGYRTAIEGVERYLTYSGLISDGDVLVKMLEDLVDLFEQGVANGTPVREIVGDNPVEFSDAFLQNYADGQWIQKERARLNDTIDRAAEDETKDAR
ncbi:MAG: DUF1048 domain-containing protein [Pseudolysinimonas sp.]